MKKTAQQVQEENNALVAERGPGLYYDMGTYAVVKDSTLGMVMIGGLGSFGNGRSWHFLEAKENLAGLAEAPEDPEMADSFGESSVQAYQRRIQIEAEIKRKKEGE